MTQAWAETVVNFTIAYAVVGIVFGAIFVLRGVARVDPSAEGGGWAFKLLILPGVAALWPVLLRRWLSSSGEPPTEVTAHRRASR